MLPKLFTNALRRIWWKSFPVHSRYFSIVQENIKKSYYAKPGNIVFRSSTIGELPDEAADKNGDGIAYISEEQGISKTFSEFRHEVKKLASGLLSLGLRKGDTIAICCPNSYEWPLVQFASAKAGLILVKINPASQSKELIYYLNKTSCKLLIMRDKVKSQDYYQIMCNATPELPTSRPGNLCSQNIPSLKWLIMITEERKEGIVPFSDVMNSGNHESDKILADTEKSIQFDDPVSIQFTSGTTGMPKGATLTHHNLVNNALRSGSILGFDQKTVMCCQVPLFHCFGCVTSAITSMLYRNQCVFPSFLFNADSSLQAIENYKCTSVFGTPTMFVDYLRAFQHKKYKLHTLKQVLIGGAPVSESLVNELHEIFKIDDIRVAYGMTETSPGSAVSKDLQDSRKRKLTLIEDTEAKIIDEKGDVVPVNTDGQLCIRGYLVFAGYWEDAEKTNNTMDKGHWLKTGDLSRMNEDGTIQVIGRIKDMIIRGGENIYPEEIENFISTHPAVLEVQIVGVPDERMGEEICACINLKTEQKITEEEIKNFCKGEISHFKVPRYIMFVTQFPKTVSGKIKKHELRRIASEKFNL